MSENRYIVAPIDAMGVNAESGPDAVRKFGSVESGQEYIVIDVTNDNTVLWYRGADNGRLLDRQQKGVHFV